VKHRVLAVVVLLSCAVLVAVVVVYGGVLPVGESGRRGAPGLLESDLDAESQELDRQLQSITAHREPLMRVSADLIAGRTTLPEAASVICHR
jgi:hypothetical protein